jgi:hypothetical protein
LDWCWAFSPHNQWLVELVPLAADTESAALRFAMTALETALATLPT